MEKEVKPTHLVTVFKIKEFHLDEDNILILFPVEATVGEIGRTKKFIDTDKQEYLPIMDAFKKKLSYGYAREVEVKEIMSRGYETLVKYFNHEPKKLQDGSNLLQKFKEEYVGELKYFVYFYDLSELVPMLSCEDQGSFYEEYGYSIDRKTGMLSTEEPILEDEEIYGELEREAEELDEQEAVMKEKSKAKVTVKEEMQQPKESVTRRSLINYVKCNIIAQDEQVEEIASAIYNPLMLKSTDLKRNIMIYGPTGVGKTEIIKLIAKELNLPFYKANVASFSASGYVGDSVEDIYKGLYLAAGRNLKRLEAGAIVLLDEIDKLLISESGTDIKKQVYNELLTTLDPGGTVQIQISQMSDPILYDKSNLIVISTGSFGLLDRKKLDENNSKIGFGSSEKQLLGQTTFKHTTEDFIKAGVPIEFLARQHVKVGLNALNIENLYQILEKSLLSPYHIYRRNLKERKVHINIPESALRSMAEKAYKLQCGARSLIGIFDSAIRPEYNNVIDELDNGIDPGSIEFNIDNEQVVKRLEHYHG